MVPSRARTGRKRGGAGPRTREPSGTGQCTMLWAQRWSRTRTGRWRRAGGLGQRCCVTVVIRSKNKHASRHFHATEHPLVPSFQPDEDWVRCYVDKVFMEPIQLEEGR